MKLPCERIQVLHLVINKGLNAGDFSFELCLCRELLSHNYEKPLLLVTMRHYSVMVQTSLSFFSLCYQQAKCSVLLHLVLLNLLLLV
jgi:hypothetical protein